MVLYKIDVGYLQVGLFTVSGRRGSHETGSEVIYNVASEYFDDCEEEDIVFADGDKK